MFTTAAQLLDLTDSKEYSSSYSLVASSKLASSLAPRFRGLRKSFICVMTHGTASHTCYIHKERRAEEIRKLTASASRPFVRNRETCPGPARWAQIDRCVEELGSIR
jgi:hypothetical protein